MVQNPGHSWENAFFWGRTRTRERFKFLTTAGSHKNDQIGRRKRDRKVCLRSKAEGRKLLVLIKEILHDELLHSLCGCSWDAKKTAFTDRENRVGRKQTHTHIQNQKVQKIAQGGNCKGRVGMGGNLKTEAVNRETHLCLEKEQHRMKSASWRWLREEIFTEGLQAEAQGSI